MKKLDSKKIFKVLKLIVLIVLTIIFCNSFNIIVKADTIQIEDSTDYNYYIDLRDNQYKIGRTLIQEGIITTTCSYLPNSYGCGIQVPLTSTLKVQSGKKYTFSFLVATDNRTLQVSTWKNNLILVPDGTSTTTGVYRMYNYKPEDDSTTYNADVSISLQDSNSNIKIYKIDYSFTAKLTANIKVVTFAFGENYNGDSTTGTLQFSYFMVDATNQEIVDAVKDLSNDIKDLDNTIKDTSVPSFDQDKFLGYLPENALSSILNLPLNIMNTIVTSLNSSTCTPITLPIPFLDNKTYQLECISVLFQKMGVSTIINFIGTLLGAFMLYNYLINLYKWVDATLTFRENNWEGYD